MEILNIIAVFTLVALAVTGVLKILDNERQKNNKKNKGKD